MSYSHDFHHHFPLAHIKHCPSLRDNTRALDPSHSRSTQELYHRHLNPFPKHHRP